MLILLFYLLASDLQNEQLFALGVPAVKVFTYRDGLPVDAVTSVFVDHEGTTWVGTDDGVAYFDGKRWQTLALPNESQSKRVTDLHRDSNGTLWVATEKGGVAYLGAEGSGTIATDDAAILAGNAQRVFLATSSGLEQLAPRRVRFSDLAHPVTGLAFHSHRLYGIHAGGLFYIDGDVVESVELDLQNLKALVSLNDDLILMNDRGLLKYDPRNREVTFVTAYPKASFKVVAAGKGLGDLGEAQIWVSSPFETFLWSNDRWHDWNQSLGLSGRGATDFALATREPFPVLWLATRGNGLFRLAFNGVRAFPLKNYSNPGVIGFAEIGEDWITISGSGLLKLTDDQGMKPVLPALEGTKVTCVYSQQGETFIGGYNVLGTLQSESGFEPLVEDFPYTVSVLRGARTRRGLWIGTRQNGLWSWQGGGLRAQPVFERQKVFVTALLETQDGLYVGTTEGLFARREGQWQKFGVAEGLPQNTVYSVDLSSKDQDSFLWIGTGNGLAMFNPKDQSIVPVEDLANTVVYGCAQDPWQRTYVLTNQGVALLDFVDQRPQRITTLTEDSGLPHRETNRGGILFDQQGRLWVGTLSGAAVYWPRPPNFGASYPLDFQSVVALANGVKVLPNDRLSHDHLLFQYHLRTSFREQDTLYRSQLMGLEATASAWSLRDTREINALTSGSYTMKVWAKDYLGREHGPAQFSFTIDGPWWEEKGTMLLAAVVLSFVLALISTGLRRLLRRNLSHS